MKKHLLTSSRNGGIKLKRNAFTLIELLAIIVILAIIAVITVPIILNIIENSRKGAAADSAYGFKDSINKYYITKLSDDRQFQLEGEYNFSGGKLTGDTINTTGGDTISISGTVPTSAELHYKNNVLKGGCIVIGEYESIFTGSDITSTVKGDCSEYEFIDPDVEETCIGPNCIYYKYNRGNNYKIGDSIDNIIGYTDDYNSFGNNFLSFILKDDKVYRNFVCGKEGGQYFCLEGVNTSKYSDNVSTLDKYFSTCSYNESKSKYTCSGTNIISAYADNSGVVSIFDGTYGCAVRMYNGLNVSTSCDS